MRILLMNYESTIENWWKTHQQIFLIFNWIFLVLVKKFVENFVLGIGTIFFN